MIWMSTCQSRIDRSRVNVATLARVEITTAFVAKRELPPYLRVRITTKTAVGMLA